MPERIVSLVPDASAWLRVLGLSDRLAAGTPGCRDRSGRTDLPICTEPESVPATQRALIPWDPVPRDPGTFLDQDVLRASHADVVIADCWNETWPDDLPEQLQDLLGRPVELWWWNVRTLRDTLEQGLRLGRRFGVMEDAMRFLGDREAELLEWRARTGVHRRAPDSLLDPVLVLSSLDPPAPAAGWAAEVVDRAAARLVTARSGESAVEIPLEQLPLEARSLVVVCLPGYSASDTHAVLDARKEMVAIREATVGVVCYDGRGTFDGSGPGLHEAILDLMSLVHGLEGRDLSGRSRWWSGTPVGTAGTR